MTNDEIIEVVTAHKAGKTIEIQVDGKGEWDAIQFPNWCFSMHNYRVRRQGIPKPMTREMFPTGTFWLLPPTRDIQFLVVALSASEANVVGYRFDRVSFETLAKEGWKYSTDRCEWVTCRMEAPSEF